MNIEYENQFMLLTYRSGSLTKAAQILGVSQPALSMRISKAEEKLGFTVFNRRTVPIGVTEKGDIYLSYLERQESLAREYNKRLDDWEGNESSQLAIGGPAVYMETIIATAIAKLHEYYPRCDARLKIATLSELLPLAKERKVDCFVSASDELPEEFEIVKVKKEKLYLCIPKDWEINEQIKEYQVLPGEQGRCFDYHILDGMRFIFLEENQPLQKEIQHFFDDYRICPDNCIRLNQVITGVKLAALGEGIFIACEEAIAGCGNTDKLAVYSLPEKFSDRQIYIAYNRDHYLSKACQKLIAILREMDEKGK